MAYTEFFVSNDAANTGAADTNGGGPRYGALGAPIYNPSTNISRLTAATLKDTSGSAWWNGCAIADWICVNNAGAYTIHYIKSFSTTTNANDTITVSPDLPAAVTSAKVGGMWATIAGSNALLAAIGAIAWRAISSPIISAPRLNVHASGTDYSTATNPAFDFTGAWDATSAGDTTNLIAVPYTIEGFSSIPGDLRESTTRPVLTTSAATTSLIIGRFGEWCIGVAIDLYHPGAAGAALIVAQLNNAGAGLRNCRVRAGANTTNNVTCVDMATLRNFVLRCDITRAAASVGATATGILAQSSTNGTIVGNIIEGPSSTEAATTLGTQRGIAITGNGQVIVVGNVIFNHDAGIVNTGTSAFIYGNSIGRNNRRNIYYTSAATGTQSSQCMTIDNAMGDISSASGYHISYGGSNAPIFVPWCDGNVFHGVQLGAYDTATVNQPNSFDNVLADADAFYNGSTMVNSTAADIFGYSVSRTFARSGAEWERTRAQAGAFVSGTSKKRVFVYRLPQGN